MKNEFADVDRRIPNYWREIFSVERGLRSTGIIEVPDESISYLCKYLDSRKISYEIITAGKLNEERVRRGQDLLMNYHYENLFYIGDEMRKVKTLIEGDYNNDFFCVGMMLGYPDCCIVAFYRRGTESVDVDKLRSGFPLISHVPCSENCVRTAVYNSRLQKDKDMYLAEMANERGAG
jgi:hypothetical protein